MDFGYEEVRQAIAGLRAKLNRSEDLDLQAAFDAGLHPNILTYGKLGVELPSLPIIDRYLVGATSFLHQPSNYYDIFRACRCVYVVQFLDAALTVLLNKGVQGTKEKMLRLVREMEHDGFDAVMFEFVTAARYAEHPSTIDIEFIPESPGRKTPDLRVKWRRGEAYVECKKVDRDQNFTIQIRNVARDLLNNVIERFRVERLSVLGEATYNCDAATLDQRKVVDAFWAAFEERTTIVESAFSAKVIRLPHFRSDDFTLWPSPKLNSERYGYKLRGPWFGIVQQFFGSRGIKAGMAPELKGGISSWINEVEWDAAIKWRITSEDVLARYQRFGFDGVFNGIEQVKNGGPDSAVHIWLETEHSVGNRKSAIVDLRRRVLQNPSHRFGWIILNETLFDISPGGRFDLIEHGHFIRGPTAAGRKAPVTGVFASEVRAEGPEFGLGAVLPDIDEA